MSHYFTRCFFYQTPVPFSWVNETKKLAQRYIPAPSQRRRTPSGRTPGRTTRASGPPGRSPPPRSGSSGGKGCRRSTPGRRLAPRAKEEGKFATNKSEKTVLACDASRRTLISFPFSWDVFWGKLELLFSTEPHHHLISTALPLVESHQTQPFAGEKSMPRFRKPWRLTHDI